VAIVLGVDGGNSKTELLAASLDGELVAHTRGPGNNVHFAGVEATVDFLGRLVAEAGVDVPAAHGVFYLCGVDVPADRDGLTSALARTSWLDRASVDNDVFGLLRAGTDEGDAVAVVCGAGINCAGRSADGRVARYPSLGWESGDWGGSVMLGREVLFLAARAEDGRGEPTVLSDLVREHFGLPVAEVGEAVRYRRIPVARLGELAPAVVRASEEDDAVARQLVERLADEVVLMAARALADLGLTESGAPVLLGGGMLRSGTGRLYEEVVARLARAAAKARPTPVPEPPVLGAALDAFAAEGADRTAIVRLRGEFSQRT
jgi:N-acetylglucosamine kinase-like BadF-type ATPase